MKKLFLAKGRKIIELPYELHHVFVMMIAYHKNAAWYNERFEEYR